MTYQAERWAPLPIAVDVFLIALETTEDLKTLLGATSVRVAYNRGGTILVEWTMMHRETFAGLVGEYIIRNDNNEFQVVTADELMSKWAPVVESKEEERANKLAELGELLAVHNQDGVIDEILFKMPDGTPAAFILKTEEHIKKDELPEEIEGGYKQATLTKVDDNGVPLEAVNVIPNAENVSNRPNPSEIHRITQQNLAGNRNKERNR